MITELVIFNSPSLLAGYGAALFLTLFDFRHKVTGYVFTGLSLVLFMVTTAQALLAGATLRELCLPALAFLLLHLRGFSDLTQN